MEKISKKILIVGILVISLAISIVLITLGIAIKSNKKNPEPWILQSYGNNVALYNGEEVVEVYGAIVLDNLPDEDKRLLDSGISFLTKEEAKTAIEDYDG